MKDSIQILVIHVRGKEDRRQFIQKQLDELGMPYEYILDGNVEDLTPEILDRYFKDDMYGTYPRTSCAYKEFLAYRYILDHNLSGALILEDDIRLFNDFQTKFFRSIEEYESNALEPVIINYEESSLLLVPRSKRKRGQMLYEAKRDRYTGCYYINNNAAQAIIEFIQREKCSLPLDRFHTQLVEKGIIRYYWSYPCLACQCSCDGSMPTMIPTRPRPYKRLKWFYKRFYKHLLYWFR